MNKFSARAVRQGNTVEVTVRGVLPNSSSKSHYNAHSEIEVIIEGNGTIKVPISKIEDEFIVINMISGIIPPPSYSIVPALSEINPEIYEKSFGSNTYGACKQFVKENTVAESPYVLEFSGSRSGAPRGLL